MKLLLVNYEYPPVGGGGGKATHNLAKSLVSLGHKVDVLTSKYKSYSIDDVPNGLNIHRVRSSRKSLHDCGMFGAFSFLIFALPVFLKLLRTNKYDAIHYFFSLPTGILSLFAKNIKDRSSIVSLRGSDVPGYDPYNTSLQLFHRLLLPVTKKIWRNADHVIAVAESLRKEAIKTVNDVDIHVLPNGVEKHFIEQATIENTSEEFVIITVARLVERKGIQLILKALSQMDNQNIKLKIVGEGNYESELKTLTKELGLDSVVEFLGYRPSAELPKILANSDIFLLLSLAEAFGNVFAEAMAAGLPIVGSQVGGIEELVGPENGILIPLTEHPEESIIRAIRELRDNPEKRKTMGRKNALKMKEKYQWNTIAASYIDFYKNKS